MDDCLAKGGVWDGGKCKPLNHELVKKQVRSVLSDPAFLEKHFITKEQASALLQAKRWKAEMRTVLKNMVEEEAEKVVKEGLKDFYKKSYKTIHSIIESETMNFLRNRYSFEDLVNKAVEKHAANKFEDIIALCLKKSYVKVHKDVLGMVRNLSNLKTSTITEISGGLSRVKRDEEVLKDLVDDDFKLLPGGHLLIE